MYWIIRDHISRPVGENATNTVTQDLEFFYLCTKCTHYRCYIYGKLKGKSIFLNFHFSQRTAEHGVCSVHRCYKFILLFSITSHATLTCTVLNSITSAVSNNFCINVGFPTNINRESDNKDMVGLPGFKTSLVQSYQL